MRIPFIKSKIMRSVVLNKDLTMFGTIIILYLITTPLPTFAVIEDVLDVIHVTKEVTTSILKAWDIVQSSPLTKNIDFPLLREKQKQVFSRLNEVNRQIKATEEKYAQNIAMAIEAVNTFGTKHAKVFTKMNEVTNTMNSISTRYQQMQHYKNNEEKFETSTLIQFAEWTVSPNTYSIPQSMNNLHLSLLGSEEKSNTTTNILTLLLQNYEESGDQICYTQQSPQQFIYSLYTDIALTELKGYTMMEFSWMMLRIYGKGNFTQEAELMRSDYQKRTQRTLKLLSEVMRRADRIVWRCDPNKFVKNKTYDEVTRLLQGYVENEVDMNTDDTCREDCSFYQSARSEGCFKDLYCARQPRCSGKLYHCTFVDSDMWICPSDFGNSRRYEYIEYENGRVLGQKSQCTRGSTKVDSWWRWIFWHCSYCFCLCDEQGIKSDRYFNLRETLSDTEKNKVITGLRFVKHNRVFHIQIQEGELLPRGNINSANISWKPLDSYNIYDRNVRNGRDYHTLTYESRSIDLDDIHTDDNTFVVTGVRFRVIGAHLNLEARLSEIDFERGKLISPELNSFWKSNDNTDVSGDRRQKIKLVNPDVPTRTITKSLPDSQHNQYIDFVNTNMDKDAAQTTVPFLDIQDVVCNPPVPLAGIGIYHKGLAGFGGFLAPKIITYDFSPHISIPDDYQ